MSQASIELAIFAAKGFIIVIIILLILIGFLALLARGKQKAKGHLAIKNLNKKYNELSETILAETLSKKEFKHFLKAQKSEEKKKVGEKVKHLYVLNFHGDIKASGVDSLREEITAILNVATPEDEVLLRLESAGGVVHGYGLAAAQLMRLRARQIPLVVSIDKLAASGGYMMAAVANKIIAAPFAIIGSIGVIVQLPNFNRLLKDKHIDFEQQTAGEFKRTITMFGENTEEGRQKLQHEIEDIHQLFKKLITDYRKDIDIAKVATGEHWLGEQAIGLKLIDEIKTSDDYMLEQSKNAKLFEVCYEMKKPLLARLTMAKNNFNEHLSSQILPMAKCLTDEMNGLENYFLSAKILQSD